MSERDDGMVVHGAMPYRECTAMSKRTGKKCKSPAIRGRDKCRMHGGNAKRGHAAPNFKHGKYSKMPLPSRLLERYEQEMTNPDLLSIRKDVALFEVALQEEYDKLDGMGTAAAIQEALRHYNNARTAAANGDAKLLTRSMEQLGEVLESAGADEDTWARILDLADKRSKLVEREANRVHKSAQSVSMAEVMLMFGRLGEVVRDLLTRYDVPRGAFYEFDRQVEVILGPGTEGQPELRPRQLPNGREGVHGAGDATVDAAQSPGADSESA